jgi:prepilin-type N-terminal cleavage/methylation domain-containing protein/prepilin-type processing-associated H-X9-DG protein
LTRPGRIAAFTLVELLVVISIIGVLVAMLLPAVQAARETSRRASCMNRLRQMTLAMQNHVAAVGAFPNGSVSRPMPNAAGAPWTFYRWSALAALTPYMENSAVHDALDFERPLYDGAAGLQPSGPNRDVVRLVIPDFLCPSDLSERLTESFGPTNYAVCTGTGVGNPEIATDDGSPHGVDGVFGVNSATRPGQITDGLSKTVLLSESTLGRPADASPHDPAMEYQFITAAPLRESVCRASSSWNYTDPRGFSWANGEHRCTLYNHHDTPNPPTPDCMGVLIGGGPDRMFTPYGWRAARSLHPGGVNVALADGSVRFIGDDVDSAAWRAGATVAGGDSDDL